MKVFAIYKNENTNEFNAVKKGFSWPGFFFGWIWAFVKGLAGIGALLLLWVIISNIIVYSGQDESASIIISIIGLVIAIIVGSKGNSWREKKLIEKGFKYIDDITSNSPDVAISLFIQKQEQSTPTKASTDDVVIKLEKLSKLKEKGILTEEEFLTQKKKILDV